MKNLDKLFAEVLEDFDALDIKYGKIVDIKPNSRAQSRWGQCQKRADGYHININVALLADNIGDQGAKETIAHEICHTIKGCMNHGEQWKHYAQLLSVFGYNIKRTNSAADKGISTEQHIANKNYKYLIRCEKCGNLNYYTKRSKVVNLIATEKYHGCRCGKCNSHNLVVEKL